MERLVIADSQVIGKTHALSFTYHIMLFDIQAAMLSLSYHDIIIASNHRL